MPSGQKRFDQELIGRPIADDIYKRVFGNDVVIERYEHGNGFILDRHFAIDVKLKLVPCGLLMLGQEKFLSHEYSSFKTLTVEYEQDQFTNEDGDWYKLAAQFYLCGYLTKDQKQFEPWVLINWPMLVWATHGGLVNWQDNVNKDGRARASFKYVFMKDIPSGCIIASSKIMRS